MYGCLSCNNTDLCKPLLKKLGNVFQCPMKTEPERKRTPRYYPDQCVSYMDRLAKMPDKWTHITDLPDYARSWEGFLYRSYIRGDTEKKQSHLNRKRIVYRRTEQGRQTVLNGATDQTLPPPSTRKNASLPITEALVATPVGEAPEAVRSKRVYVRYKDKMAALPDGTYQIRKLPNGMGDWGDFHSKAVERGEVEKLGNGKYRKVKKTVDMPPCTTVETSKHGKEMEELRKAGLIR